MLGAISFRIHRCCGLISMETLEILSESLSGRRRRIGNRIGHANRSNRDLNGNKDVGALDSLAIDT